MHQIELSWFCACTSMTFYNVRNTTSVHFIVASHRMPVSWKRGCAEHSTGLELSVESALTSPTCKHIPMICPVTVVKMNSTASSSTSSSPMYHLLSFASLYSSFTIVQASGICVLLSGACKPYVFSIDYVLLGQWVWECSL